MEHFQMQSNGWYCLWHWKCLQQDHIPSLQVGCSVYMESWTQVLYGKPTKVLESRLHILIWFFPCLIGMLRDSLHSWGPLTHDIQIMWLVEKSKMVQSHFTLDLGDQGIWMNEKYAWRPTWHKVDSISCCTRYCIRPIQRDGYDANLGAMANNWLSLAPKKNTLSWWGPWLPTILNLSIKYISVAPPNDPLSL